MPLHRLGAHRAGHASDHRLVAMLLSLIDSLPAKVVLLAATNRPNSLDSALRRPGRIDREVEVSVPDATARAEILRVHLRTVPHDIEPELITGLARDMHGYVGADIAAVVAEAALGALSVEDGSGTVEIVHFRSALTLVKPSAMREMALEVPCILST